MVEHCVFEDIGEGRRRCAACGTTITATAATIHRKCVNLSAKPICGPGCHLSRLLAWFWIKADDSCSCKARAAEMDRNGPDWCEAHADTIVGWLREAAEERGMAFYEFGARAAVALAIWRSRRELPPPPSSAAV